MYLADFYAMLLKKMKLIYNIIYTEIYKHKLPQVQEQNVCIPFCIYK